MKNIHSIDSIQQVIEDGSIHKSFEDWFEYVKNVHEQYQMHNMNRDSEYVKEVPNFGKIKDYYFLKKISDLEQRIEQLEGVVNKFI
jgi:hypothetical protein